MRIQTVTMNCIRNHAETVIQTEAGINVFVGRNGHGKTSILEAVSLCCHTKTFVPCDDKSLIGFSSAFCSASMIAESDLSIPYKISVGIPREGRKKITSSTGTSLSPYEVIGQVPMVVLSPDFKSITAGAPQERRTFIDTVLSQASTSYMEDVLTLKRILKQRNALLHTAKQTGHWDATQLDVWTDALISTATEIVLKRAQFLLEFSGRVRTHYEKVSGGEDDVILSYAPDSIKNIQNTVPLVSDVQDQYKRAFAVVRNEELRRGTTVLGPQKDDVLIMIGGGVARECASQGQHKSLLIALKLAEFTYLHDSRNETPIVLLDDIFSELDDRRTANVLNLIPSDAQTFITTTTEDLYRNHIGSIAHTHALFYVERGRVRQAT